MLRERIDRIYNSNMTKWDSHDKNCFYAYCMGVLKNKIDKVSLELIEKEFIYWNNKSFSEEEKKNIKHQINFEMKHNNMDEEKATELMNDLGKAKEYLNRD